MVVEIMKGITKAAKQANGRSQACTTCPLNRSRGVCLPEILNKDLNRLISAKAQVTKVQRNIDKYVAYNKAHNLFFDESTDVDLLKAREKLEAKIANVKEAEERMKLKIKQIQEGRNGKN